MLPEIDGFWPNTPPSPIIAFSDMRFPEPLYPKQYFKKRAKQQQRINNDYE
jgi:hypothetical protein